MTEAEVIKLNEKFEQCYVALYTFPDYNKKLIRKTIADFDECCIYNAEEYPEINKRLRALVEYREDLLVSDREVAAFMFAIDPDVSAEDLKHDYERR